MSHTIELMLWSVGVGGGVMTAVDLECTASTCSIRSGGHSKKVGLHGRHSEVELSLLSVVEHDEES